MYIAIAIFLLIVSVALHELAHAFIMHRKGVRFSRIGLGIPIKFLPSFSFKIYNPYEIIIEFNFLLLGAYVEPSLKGKKYFETLPYEDKADILGAGVAANIFFAGVLLLTDLFLTHNSSLINFFVSIKFLFVVFIMLLVTIGFKWFCRYLIPILSFVLLSIIFSLAIDSPMEVVSGPVGIVVLTKEMAVDMQKTIFFSAILSFAVAITNILPLMPLDGGRIIDALFEKFIKDKARLAANQISFRILSGVTFIALIILAFVSDGYNMFFK